MGVFKCQGRTMWSATSVHVLPSNTVVTQVTKAKAFRNLQGILLKRHRNEMHRSWKNRPATQHAGLLLHFGTKRELHLLAPKVQGSPCNPRSLQVVVWSQNAAHLRLSHYKDREIMFMLINGLSFTPPLVKSRLVSSNGSMSLGGGT